MAFDRLVSIIIVTRNRPRMVRDCLAHLEQQTVAPDEVIVVDSSTGEDTQVVLDGYPDTVRLRISDGRNNRPLAKNLGIAHARGEVVAFLDDDSMAQPNWLRCLLQPYADPAVGGVGGRVLDVVDAYEQRRITPEDLRIGIVEPTGKITTNFALDSGKIVEVDHFRGCNMSFRRSALQAVRGFDVRYIGTNVMEETDVCVRVKQAGWRLLFQPTALVNHFSAPREEFDREREQTDPVAVLSEAHNRSYFFFKNYGVNYYTIKHLLAGWQLLYISRWWQDRRWDTWHAIFIYCLGAWWGLADSIIRRFRSLQ